MYGNKVCKCSGWKNSTSPPNQSRQEANQVTADVETLCRTCNHSLASHIALLEDKTDEELDKVLSMVIDLESLYICCHNEKNEDTKKLYTGLFKLLRKCIVQCIKPTIEAAFLGHPPFEKPSIESVCFVFFVL